jgi:hypothetical protein
MDNSHNTISLSCKLIRNVTPEFEMPKKVMEGQNTANYEVYVG